VSCAHWLSWKCGISLTAARDKVRVAKALDALPKLSDAMSRGVLSHCKARALTRVATPDNEDYLSSIAETGTVSHVEKMVRLYRKADRAQELSQANTRSVERCLSYYFDEDGSLVVQRRLDPEQGALAIKALQAATEALREAEHDSHESSDAPDSPHEPAAARRADVLLLLAETFLGQGATALCAGDRHLMTVHVDEQVLRDASQEGRCEIDEGPALPPATVRRLCCDGSLVPIVEDTVGCVVPRVSNKCLNSTVVGSLRSSPPPSS